jgi:hypothetical protein
MKHYCPTGRRNHGRPLKRLLDSWDRNGSTGGPTAWQIDDDDEYDDNDDDDVCHWILIYICNLDARNYEHNIGKGHFERYSFSILIIKYQRLSDHSISTKYHSQLCNAL